MQTTALPMLILDGKNNDAFIFNESEFNKWLVRGMLDIPGQNYLPGTHDCKVPFIFIRDKAFALTKTMIRLYGWHFPSVEHCIFNYRLSQVCRYIECSFGHLTDKWRIFHRPLNVNIDLAIDIIKACVILQNCAYQR